MVDLCPDPNICRVLANVGTMIFRDRGKRTENAESTIGNGKRIFKRKNTEMYF